MLLVGGENLIDFIQIESDDGNPVYQANPGGSPYNCAKAIALQAVPISYLTPISTDSLGQLLADGLTNTGVHLCGGRRDEPSTMAVVSLQDGAASYQFYRQDTADRMVSLDSLLASGPQDTTTFHVGSVAITDGEDAEIWTDFVVLMHELGVFTSLDPNIRPTLISDRAAFMARMDRLLRATDLLKLSDEDLEWLYPGVDQGTAVYQLLDQSSAKLLVLTLGADGALALFGGEKIAIDAAPLRKLKDTVGAGDIFMATLLTGLHRSGDITASALEKIDCKDVFALLQRAAVAAALNCEKSGCNPPSLGELNARISENLEAEKS